MPELQIEAKGCRSCALCVDVCPTKVFDQDPGTQQAKATRQGDCIGCLSCEYICPSRCVTVSGAQRQLPFYHQTHARNIVSKFLQQKPAQEQIDTADVSLALRDVSNRLRALGDSATETMGRGLKVVGRTAGTLAAAHLPDLYEETTLAALLSRLQQRFAGSFSFDFTIDEGGAVKIAFTNCALKSVVTDGQGTVGSHALCVLFHDYWAGLVGEFCKQKFTVQSDAGNPCSLTMAIR